MNTLSTFQANRLAITVFNVLFNKRTWKTAFITMSVASMVLTYHLIRSFYVFRCAVKIGGITEEYAGMFESKDTCNAIAQDWMSARNYEAEQRNTSSMN